MTAKKRPTRASQHRKLLNDHRPHYEALLAFQGGCGICGRAPSERRRLDIDHDHLQMVVRGLLCVRCNQAIPSWMDPAWCRAAAEYLESPPYENFKETL